MSAKGFLKAYMANRGEKVEVETDFTSLGSKSTTDGDCSHEIKIVPWKKSYNKPR